MVIEHLVSDHFFLVDAFPAAQFDVHPTRWNIIYGSRRCFEHLCMHKIHDTISFEIGLVLRGDRNQ